MSERKNEEKFTLEQLSEAEEFRRVGDILMAVLDPAGMYTKTLAAKAVREYLEKAVV